MRYAFKQATTLEELPARKRAAALALRAQEQAKQALPKPHREPNGITPANMRKFIRVLALDHIRQTIGREGEPVLFAREVVAYVNQLLATIDTQDELTCDHYAPKELRDKRELTSQSKHAMLWKRLLTLQLYEYRRSAPITTRKQSQEDRLRDVDEWKSREYDGEGWND
jgi:hypothetical protein